MILVNNEKCYKCKKEIDRGFETSWISHIAKSSWLIYEQWVEKLECSRCYEKEVKKMSKKQINWDFLRFLGVVLLFFFVGIWIGAWIKN